MFWILFALCLLYDLIEVTPLLPREDDDDDCF